MSLEDHIIPEQQTGVESNTESSVELKNEKQASNAFFILKERLLNVNNWHSIAGKLTAAFQLTDANGDPVNRKVEKCDHFKIDIPAPGPVTGNGYDWVQVEEIEEEKKNDFETLAIRVRPATNPNNDNKDVAHFFGDDATSCFMVKREGKKLTAAVYGRNEKPNTDAESIVDKARNVAIATGAVAGGAKLQWKSLVEGLVKDL
jgi:hypothetical protein